MMDPYLIVGFEDSRIEFLLKDTKAIILKIINLMMGSIISLYYQSDILIVGGLGIKYLEFGKNHGIDQYSLSTFRSCVYDFHFDDSLNNKSVILSIVGDKKSLESIIIYDNEVNIEQEEEVQRHLKPEELIPIKRDDILCPITLGTL